jgi:hypothetical protein
MLSHKILMAGAFALAMPAAASATIIDFDDLASGVSVGSHYAGVTFSNAVTGVYGGLPGGSAPIAIVSESDFSQPQPGNPISAVFDVAVSFVSLTGVDVGENGFLLQAFDAAVGGNLIGSASVAGTGIGIGEFYDLVLSVSGIYRIEFSQVSNLGGGDGMAFDNLEYEAAAPIPLPAALPLSLMALGGLAALGRRKRKTA